MEECILTDRERNHLTEGLGSGPCSRAGVREYVRRMKDSCEICALVSAKIAAVDKGFWDGARWKYDDEEATRRE